MLNNKKYNSCEKKAREKEERENIIGIT